ncbi:unnamed protein product, partial [Heterosigma akashiwo]
MPGEVRVEHPTRRLARKHNRGRLKWRIILACDTNAHFALRYSKSEDRRGREMEVFSIQQGLAVMNRRSRFTTYDGSRGATKIDVVLAEEDLGSLVSGWRVVPEQSDCDHNYLQEEVQRGLQVAAGRGALLEVQPGTEGEVDQQVEVLTEVLWKAFTATTPKRKRPLWKRSVPWWTEELGRVKKAFYRARTRRRKSEWHRHDYQRMAVEWKKAMRRAKADSWRRFCSEVENPWDMIHKILKGERPSSVSTIKDAEGQVIADPQQSVQAMVDGFWPDAAEGGEEGDDELEAARAQLAGRAQAFEEDCRRRLQEEGERPLTEEKVRWVVMRRRGFKAPGPDMVYGRVLAEAGEILMPYLRPLYNTCLKLGYIPGRWK